MENYLQDNGVYRAVLLAERRPGTNYTIDSELIANFARSKDIFIPFGNINVYIMAARDWVSKLPGSSFFR